MVDEWGEGEEEDGGEGGEEEEVEEDDGECGRAVAVFLEDIDDGA